MVLERMALVGDALSHVSLPGLALGLLYNFNPFFGAFTFLFTSAVVIWHLGRVTKLPFETLVGAMFTLALAVGILIVPEAELLEALFGDITNVSLLDLAIAAIVSVTVVLLTKVIFKKIVLSLISEELAVSYGVNVERNTHHLLLVSLVVAIGIKHHRNSSRRFSGSDPAAAARLQEFKSVSVLNPKRGIRAVSSFVGIMSGRV
jgi:ABC-type Mn2+/Zn2+ transport system permease subunit